MKIPLFLLEGHKRFLNNSHPEQEGLQKKLLQDGQAPEVLWVGCSDSRVMPETIVNSSPGDLFVVRNVGNMVPSYEAGGSSVGAAIEFSLGTLGINHAIVCGHEDCGMMKAIQDGGVDSVAMPRLSKWIKETLHDLKPASSEIQDLTELTKHNILLQVERLRLYPIVSKAIAERDFTLHAWFINMSCGNLEAYDFEKKTWMRLVDME